MSQPLLLARKVPGTGPKVPLGGEFDLLVVEGLAEGCTVVVHLDTERLYVPINCRLDLHQKTAKGSIAYASLEGHNSCVNVWLEKSNG